MRIRFDDSCVTVSFETEKRVDIARLLFPDLMPRLKVSQDSIGVSGYGNIYDEWSWMSPDRFGQLNFMKTVFRIALDKPQTEDIQLQETSNKYLSICTDTLNLISTAYRVLMNDYFPRNYSPQDFMAYSISYSNDGVSFQHESTNTSPNVTFQTTYPDDSPLVDVNDIILDYVMRIPLHTELIMNSEDFLKDKNYRIAILEADTAVESLIYKILMNYYSHNENIPEGEFKTTFIKQLEKNRIDDNKQWLRLISNEITGGNQWANWKSYCHDVRNDVIHHNKKPTKEEVETAISAAKVLIEVLKNHLYDADDWLNEGKAFSSNNELAIQYLWKSINKKKSLQAFFHLGNIYLKNRDYESAIKYYEEALKFEDSPDCYFNMGRAYEEREIYDLAMKNFDKAIDLGFEVTHPTANPYHRKFIILTREGLEHYDLDAIIYVLKVLFEVFPNSAEICHNLIVTYNRKNDYDSALTYANTLIDLAPDNPHNYLERAIFGVKTGQKDKALDDIEKMASLDPSFKELVVSDPVFDILKNEARFKEILDDN